MHTHTHKNTHIHTKHAHTYTKTHTHTPSHTPSVHKCSSVQRGRGSFTNLIHAKWESNTTLQHSENQLHQSNWGSIQIVTQKPIGQGPRAKDQGLGYLVCLKFVLRLSNWKSQSSLVICLWKYGTLYDFFNSCTHRKCFKPANLVDLRHSRLYGETSPIP